MAGMAGTLPARMPIGVPAPNPRRASTAASDPAASASSPRPQPRPDVAVCKQLAMHRHRLGVERARLRARAQGLLDLAWPEFMAHFSGLDHATPRALLRRWPSPAAFAAAPLRSVTTLLTSVSRGQCKDATIQSLRASAETSLGLTEAGAERSQELRDLLARWALLDQQV